MRTVVCCILLIFAPLLTISAQQEDSLQRLFAIHNVAYQTEVTYSTHGPDSIRILHYARIISSNGKDSLAIIYNDDQSISLIHRYYYNSSNMLICDSMYWPERGDSVYRCEYYTYDDAGRIASRALYNGRTLNDRSAYFYDAHGNCTLSVTTHGNNVNYSDSSIRTFVYDSEDRLIESRNKEQSRYYTFDSRGNLVEDSGAGRELFHFRYVYDNENRLLEKWSLTTDRESHDTVITTTYYYINGDIKSSQRITFDYFYYDKTAKLSVDTIQTIYSKDRHGNTTQTSRHQNMNYPKRNISRSYFVYDSNGNKIAWTTQQYSDSTLKEVTRMDSTIYDQTGKIILFRNYSKIRNDSSYEIIQEKSFVYSKEGLLLKQSYYTTQGGYYKTETLYTYAYKK